MTVIKDRAMSLLRELYEEMSCGATDGAAIASFAEPMLAKPKRRVKLGNFFKLHTPKSKKRKKRLKETFDYGNFDSANVISKLDAAETKSKYQQDTVTFGLEDERGNVVRVIVDGSQAKQFEVVLAKMLGDQHDDSIENYNGTPAKEIAEILFQLKHQFNIVDVKWGELPVDEEEEPKEDEMQAQDQEGSDDQPVDDQQEDGQGIDNVNMDDAQSLDVSGETPQTGDEAGLLQKVIDMMKADAEARKADAQAREAEAKATVSKYASDTALAKVKQEEDVLDMEAYYKDRQQQDKETKTLAKLAKYKHDVASDQGGRLSSEDEEGTVSLSKLSDMIISRLKGRH